MDQPAQVGRGQRLKAKAVLNEIPEKDARRFRTGNSDCRLSTAIFGRTAIFAPANPHNVVNAWRKG
jgi:hypothetical protein